MRRVSFKPPEPKGQHHQPSSLKELGLQEILLATSDDAFKEANADVHVVATEAR
jgi:hypothetical protein